MDNGSLLSILMGIIIAVGLIYVLFFQSKKDTNSPQTLVAGTNALQLQAYERLILLVDRIALPNVISRIPNDGLSARELQLVLCKTIKDEFDHNVTQQIYVSPEAWNAVKNLKEKNLLIINQIGSSINDHSSGFDLQKRLLHYLMDEPKANLQELVSEALAFEAKKHL